MVTPLVLNYPVTLGLVVSTFIFVLLLWKLKSFMNLYAEFPTCPVLSKIVMAGILGKIAPSTTVNGYIFQQFIDISKRFQKEGMFLVWIPQPHLIIFSEEAVKIFSNEQDSLDKTYKYDILREMFGTGLISSNSRAYKKQRKLLNPAFHLGMIKSKFSIFNENAEILVKKLAELKDSSSIDIIDYIKPCAFGSISEFILGVNMNSPENKEMSEHYTKLITNITQMIVYRACNPLLYYNFMMNFVPSGRAYFKQLNDFHSITQKIILTRKKIIISNDSNGINTKDASGDEMQTRKSLAHILLEHHLKDSSFTIEDVRNQVATFLSAGYDTSAITITWCLFLLGHHPEVQDQVYNEVETISEEYIKYEDLHNLSYLDCVIKETLRLYPSVPVYGRRLGKDIQCGIYKVPKDTSIAFFPYQLHRNPKIFPDPEKFNPDRFRDGNIENLSSNYTPFAEGIRYCIGKRFAVMETKVVLAHILRHFRITSLDMKEDVELCWEIVLSPAKPLRFKLTPRK